MRWILTVVEVSSPALRRALPLPHRVGAAEGVRPARARRGRGEGLGGRGHHGRPLVGRQPRVEGVGLLLLLGLALGEVGDAGAEAAVVGVVCKEGKSVWPDSGWKLMSCHACHGNFLNILMPINTTAQWEGIKFGCSIFSEIYKAEPGGDNAGQQ